MRKLTSQMLGSQKPDQIMRMMLLVVPTLKEATKKKMVCTIKEVCGRVSYHHACFAHMIQQRVCLIKLISHMIKRRGHMRRKMSHMIRKRDHMIKNRIHMVKRKVHIIKEKARVIKERARVIKERPRVIKGRAQVIKKRVKRSLVFS